MARQVLPWIGAAAGFVISGGNPMGAQAGFAIGSLVGNAVDPIEMQGRKLGDAPSQVAAEGGARAIVFGKGCIRGTCILERGGRRVVKQRDSSGGKGGSPTTVNQRALWTFAIGLGEAIPGGTVLRIWEQEKLVYDITPGSTIPEESASFAQKFRFYDGSDTQLPDPAIEALYDDPEDAPYYRGTAYLVFPQYDTTDFGEAVPTYRVEVATVTEAVVDYPIMASGEVVLNSFRTTHSEDGSGWSGAENPEFQVQFLLPAGDERFVAYNNEEARYTDDFGVTWTESDTAFTNIGVGAGTVAGDALLIPASLDGLYRSTNGGESFVQVDPGAIWPSTLAGSPGGVVVGASVFHTHTYVSLDSGASWGPGGNHGLYFALGTASSGYLGDQFVLGANESGVSGDAAISYPSLSAGADPTIVVFTGETGESVSALGWATIGGEIVRVAGLTNGHLYYQVGSGPWERCANDLGARVNSITSRGSRLFAGGGLSGAGVIMYSDDGDNWLEADQPLVYSVQSIVAKPTELESQAGVPIPLSSVIASLHERCGHTSDDYDVAEATDLIAGSTIEQTVTGAEAINSIIGGHFLGPSDYDGQIHYIKFGKPVVKTLTRDDLIDEPETNQRKNAIEYPLKVHFFYQGSAEAYASPKATSSRYSKDLKNVGEISVSSPVTFDSGQEPAEIAAKLHKALWARAEGEIVWPVTDEHLDLVATDAVGLVYNGQVIRAMITQIEDEPGQRKLRMVRDRQSAYTANITEIPVPPAPTPPQPSISSPTILAVMDTSALTDGADDLHLLVAMSGSNDTWAGAALQRSLDGGATFNTIAETTQNAIMGTLQAVVPEASPYESDTTNVVDVQLYTDDELQSISDAQFLSEGNAFALSWMDGTTQRWELMQFRDAELIGPKTYRLSTLQRGRLNTEPAEHLVGSTFVLLDAAVLRVSMQSAWLGAEITHRAVSVGLSPESAPTQVLEYEGNSQREWPVANLLLEWDGDTVVATAVPRHRFGTEDSPIRSLNHDGFRWSATDGANTASADTDSNTPAWTFDTTGWSTPITVTVAQLNRITGEGPAVSEDIE